MRGREFVVLDCQLESEIAQLPETEREQYLKELGLVESGLSKLIRASYKLLNLITFFTAGPKETRAWTCKLGTKAPGAAGAIHTDFEKGFIKAEVINWQVLLDCGGWSAAKEKGLLRQEGKEYVVQDGDVVHFRFNV
jgi:ribosome-binding ATPase YchF (GTP1/OBG family)